MRHAVRAALALAAAVAAALPGAARAFQYQLRLGSEYRRTDTWTPENERSNFPRLDVDLGLELAGSLGGRGTVDYAGGVLWRQARFDPGTGTERRTQLDYRLHTDLFSDRRSPFGLTASARHTTDDFTSQAVGGGTSTTTAYGAAGRVDLEDRPGLNFGYDALGVKQDSRLLGESTLDVRTAHGGFTHGTTSYSLSGNYRGNFSTGTFDTDNANDQRVDLDAAATLAPSLRLRVSDSFYLRTPTRDSVFNPRQEMNAFLAQLLQYSETVPGNSQGANYAYTRSLQTLPGSPTLEATQHLLSYQLSRQLPAPEWQLRGVLGTSFVQTRQDAVTNPAPGRLPQDAVETRSTAESLAVVLAWSRRSRSNLLEARVGPTVGALQPEGQASRVGYGATAGTTAGHVWGDLQAQLSYDATWRNDLDASGWSVRQTANANANGPLGYGNLSVQLTASSDRSRTAFGPSAGRSLSLDSAYRWFQHALELQLGVTDGLANALGRSIQSDGLFLPAPYNSHQRFAVLQATTRVARYVSLTGRGRYTQNELPDRPSFAESEAFGSLDFFYGALRISLQDRYLVTEVPGGRSRINEAFIRVDRVFGSR